MGIAQLSAEWWTNSNETLVTCIHFFREEVYTMFRMNEEKTKEYLNGNERLSQKSWLTHGYMEKLNSSYNDADSGFELYLPSLCPKSLLLVFEDLRILIHLHHGTESTEGLRGADAMFINKTTVHRIFKRKLSQKIKKAALELSKNIKINDMTPAIEDNLSMPTIETYHAQSEQNTTEDAMRNVKFKLKKTIPKIILTIKNPKKELLRVVKVLDSFSFYVVHFKPKDTRAKQMKLWCDLVVSYCKFYKISKVVVKDFSQSPLFINKTLKRYLEWLVPKKECLIHGESVESVANVNETGQKGVVCTLYEIQSQDWSKYGFC
ncbi:hypothetical protein RF11_12584 [Thelohanellus kitauei]|uniref:Vacuolar protein-sorting-associated protein 25 n=1 Tax=Thelohanellus kitauei TaxID=669202 RepID=A0A0C2MPK8_THEKT|nr:hypothetical protein RF11_12584 [Thelohanellus kitauei]